MNRYKPRTTAPETDNKFYYAENIYSQSGYGLPNCTCYAWGRFYELLNEKPLLSTRDAEKWYNHDDGYDRGFTPKLGAVVCWCKGDPTTDADGSGHVAIVEDILSDGTIVTSNSAYSGEFFYIKNIAPPYNLNGYTFQGFIYHPITFTKGIPLWMLFKLSQRRI